MRVIVFVFFILLITESLTVSKSFKAASVRLNKKSMIINSSLRLIGLARGNGGV